MAKTNGTPEARTRKVKARSKRKSRINKIEKSNKPHKNKHKADRKKSTTGRRDKLSRTNTSATPIDPSPLEDEEQFQLSGCSLSKDFELVNPERHNVFIGDSTLDTMSNVISGIELMSAVAEGDNNTQCLQLSNNGKQGLLLFLKSLKLALHVERETYLGSL